MTNEKQKPTNEKYRENYDAIFKRISTVCPNCGKSYERNAPHDCGKTGEEND